MENVSGVISVTPDATEKIAAEAPNIKVSGYSLNLHALK